MKIRSAITIVRDARSDGFIRASRLFIEELGYAISELKEKPLVEWIEPGDRHHFRQVLEKGEGALTARHQSKHGGWLEFDWKIKSEPEGPVAFGVLHGKNSSAEETGEQPSMTVPGTMHEILVEMVRIIEAERPGMKCSVLLLDDNGEYVSVGAGPSLASDYNKAVEGLRIGPSVGSCGTAAYWNEVVIVEDIQNDILWRNLKDHAAKAGLAACWSYPIISKRGQVLGAAAFYNTEPRVPTQKELDGLATAARMFGLAIERGYAEEALEKSEKDRKERESELERQLNQAAKMEALGVLAGGLAHDFNNLLVSVLSNAELAMGTIAKDCDAFEMLENITLASRQAAQLCDQMLAYAGHSTAPMQVIECNGVIRELGGLMEGAFTKKATLEYDLIVEPLYVNGDKSQLSQVVMNLITNAAEALGNDPGKVFARTGIRAYTADELTPFQLGDPLEPGNYVCFEVTDLGCGMSDEVRAKIFDPFFTTKFTGRGLGLAAVSGIVLRHRGGIYIESELGKGTKFNIILPLVDAPERKPAPEREPVPEREPAPEREPVPEREPAPEREPVPDGKVELNPKTKHVLLVDDDSLVRKAIAKVLRYSKFEVTEAAGGREAIDIYSNEQDSIDCVLLDLSMPEFDGEETFRELKKIQPNIRVVLHSGYAEQSILKRFEGIGLSGALQKPSPSSAIIAKILEVVK